MLIKSWHPGSLLLAGLFLLTVGFAAGRLSSPHFPRGATGPAMFKGAGGYPIPQQDMMGQSDHQGQRRAGRGNRTVGSVTKIDGNTLTVRSRGTDLTVTVSSTTSFYKAGAIAKQSDLQVGDIIGMAGTPDSSGNIQAQTVTIQ